MVINYIDSWQVGYPQNEIKNCTGISGLCTLSALSFFLPIKIYIHLCKHDSCGAPFWDITIPVCTLNVPVYFEKRVWTTFRAGEMVNATLCKKVKLASFFVSLRHFHFFSCETETSNILNASSRHSGSEMFSLIYTKNR